MKAFFLLLGLLGPIIASAQKQKAPAKVTLLLVVARSFAEEQVVTITGDSVLVIKRTYSEENKPRMRYAQALTSKMRDDLLSSFNGIYLSRLKSSYEAVNSLTDDTAFILYIEKGKAVKNIEIYEYKLAPLDTFSKKLNRLLPLAFRLDYNDSYFRN